MSAETKADSEGTLVRPNQVNNQVNDDDDEKLRDRNRAKTPMQDLRAKPEKEWQRGLGRGLGEPFSRKCLELRTSNRSIWCI